MAQWNRTDRTLYAKLVYYGPALGGKTTNLRALHRLTDPEGRETLVSVDTSDDRTLFFDLLPFELGQVFGYKVAIKLYTVPGQVRYDATRRIVLAGADAVVFVADSTPGRERDNRRSWDDLRLNMRANGLDPRTIPVLVQLNKRDVPGAVDAETLSGPLTPAAAPPIEAVATTGDGVLETLVAAARAMLARLIDVADPGARRNLKAADLIAHVDRAFAPHLARSRGARVPPTASDGSERLVVPQPDLLESALAAGVALGERLADASGLASRREREAEALRALSDALRATGASFDRSAIVDAALESAREVLSCAAVALATPLASGRARLQRARGRSLGGLVADAGGSDLLARLASAAGPVVVDDVTEELTSASAGKGFRAVASAPVGNPPRCALVVVAPAPDGRFDEGDVRFLATLAGHLAIGLEKADLHAVVTAHRDRLEETVRERTRELREAYEDLKAAAAMKDRFLSGMSHEMRTPLTAIVGAATFLRDYDGTRADREEMAVTVLAAADELAGKVDALLRVARLRDEAGAPPTRVEPDALVAEALRLAGEPVGVRVAMSPDLPPLTGDPARLARAIANLVDNARKFGPAGEDVEVRVAPAERTVVVSVLDRGPGLSGEDTDRAFEPFEQGGDPLTGKPKGVGLGLYEARAIARRHGGSLVYLPREGGGSEFRLSLPALAGAREVSRA